MMPPEYELPLTDRLIQDTVRFLDDLALYFLGVVLIFIVWGLCQRLFTENKNEGKVKIRWGLVSVAAYMLLWLIVSWFVPVY